MASWRPGNDQLQVRKNFQKAKNHLYYISAIFFLKVILKNGVLQYVINKKQIEIHISTH